MSCLLSFRREAADGRGDILEILEIDNNTHSCKNNCGLFNKTKGLVPELPEFLAFLSHVAQVHGI
jgi:hypothetical protein